MPWEVLLRRDVLLHHPYETFDMSSACCRRRPRTRRCWPSKMTLYRTSGGLAGGAGPERAAANGKQVTVLVELKARFDEQQNIDWATRLERAGAIVVFGIARLKVHARRCSSCAAKRPVWRTYVHLGTGKLQRHHGAPLHGPGAAYRA